MSNVILLPPQAPLIETSAERAERREREVLLLMRQWSADDQLGHYAYDVGGVSRYVVGWGYGCVFMSRHWIVPSIDCPEATDIVALTPEQLAKCWQYT